MASLAYLISNCLLCYAHVESSNFLDMYAGLSIYPAIATPLQCSWVPPSHQTNGSMAVPDNRKLNFILVSLVYNSYNCFQDASKIQDACRNYKALCFLPFPLSQSACVSGVADLVLAHECPGQDLTNRGALRYPWPTWSQIQGTNSFPILHFKKYFKCSWLFFLLYLHYITSL